MTTDNTTPRPWVYKVPNRNTEDLPYIENDKGVEVLSFGNAERYYPTQGTPPSPADAAIIVRCVNSHDALVNEFLSIEMDIDSVNGGEDPLKVLLRIHAKCLIALAQAKEI